MFGAGPGYRSLYLGPVVNLIAMGCFSGRLYVPGPGPFPADGDVLLTDLQIASCGGVASFISYFPGPGDSSARVSYLGTRPDVITGAQIVPEIGEAS
jgi:hypothetical protein